MAKTVKPIPAGYSAVTGDVFAETGARGGAAASPSPTP